MECTASTDKVLQPSVTASSNVQYQARSCCRHFGGTKLGTGGLARAYGGAARECLQLAERETFHRQTGVHMQV